MTVSIVRFGTPKGAMEGLRIGTVRRPPRGVRKADYAAKHLFDVWFPNLAPSEELLKANFPIQDDAHWRTFRRRFLAEMKTAGPRRDLELLAALSHHTNLAIGCYCEDPAHCHRAILGELLTQLGADVHSQPTASRRGNA
jgi:uncharacterized protein YeaO (DUF488 family)